MIDMSDYAEISDIFHLTEAPAGLGVTGKRETTITGKNAFVKLLYAEITSSSSIYKRPLLVKENRFAAIASPPTLFCVFFFWGLAHGKLGCLAKKARFLSLEVVKRGIMFWQMAAGINKKSNFDLWSR